MIVDIVFQFLASQSSSSASLARASLGAGSGVPSGVTDKDVVSGIQAAASAASLSHSVITSLMTFHCFSPWRWDSICWNQSGAFSLIKTSIFPSFFHALAFIILFIRLIVISGVKSSSDWSHWSICQIDFVDKLSNSQRLAYCLHQLLIIFSCWSDCWITVCFYSCNIKLSLILEHHFVKMKNLSNQGSRVW